MFLDALLRVANSQTFNGASEVTASSVDIASFQPAISSSSPLTPHRRVGVGEPLVLAFFVETAAAGTGASSALYSFEVIDAANDVLTTTVNKLASVERDETELTAGAVVIVDVPMGLVAQRYLGGRIDLPLSASTIVCSAFFGPRSFVDQWIAYKRGYTV
jgi:hypothetical protein